MLIGAVGALLGATIQTPAARSATRWPGRPITVSVAFAPGGGVDTVVRGITKPAASLLGTIINVVNQPGSSGALATEYVYGRPPDGYWWLGTANYNKALRIFGYSNTVAWRDWQFFKVATTILAWAVRADSPLRTFEELLETAARRPVLISNSGIGDIWHEGTLLVLSLAGGNLRAEHIPFPGGAPAALAALQGTVDVVASGLHEQIQFLRAGQLRCLAAFTAEPVEVEGAGRIPSVADVVPEAKVYAPFGGHIDIALRRDVDAEILRRVEDALRTAMQDPTYQEMLRQRVIFNAWLSGEAADREAAFQESLSAWMFYDLKLEGIRHSPMDLGLPRPDEFQKWWPPEGYKPRL